MGNVLFCLPVRYFGKYPSYDGNMQDATLDRMECMMTEVGKQKDGNDVVAMSQKFQGFVDGICKGNAGSKSFFHMVGMDKFKCESVRLLRFF